MTLQSENKGHGWADNLLLLQLSLVTVVAFILIVLAWKFVW
jgi:hypothetical protein